MKPKRDVTSFVVRFTQDLWQDDNGEPRVEWRGHVRHVQDGKEEHFTDVATAVSFIQDELTRRTRNCLQKDGAVDPEKADRVLRESNKLWDRFAASYAGIAGAVQQTQRQMSDAVDSALRPVRWMTELVTGRDADETSEAPTDTATLLAAIRDLQNQVQSLNQQLSAISSPSTSFSETHTVAPASTPGPTASRSASTRTSTRKAKAETLMQ